ncbi:MAG: hypothetical protein ACLP1Y_07075, partial [Candidatus Acidiferrales bacterium]
NRRVVLSRANIEFRMSGIAIFLIGAGGLPIVLAEMRLYWSIKSNEGEYEDRGFGGWLLDVLYSLIHLPSSTRGSRMFHLVH